MGAFRHAGGARADDAPERHAGDRPRRGGLQSARRQMAALQRYRRELYDGGGEGALSKAQAIALSPFVFTRLSNFRDGPSGRFSPRSHLLTASLRTFK